MKLGFGGLAAAVVAAGLAFPALAGNDAPRPRGPAFGTNRYATALRTVEGRPDTDDFTAPLLAGEKLNVTVTGERKSGLMPVIQLIAPDGRVTEPAVRSRRRGRIVVLKNAEIDQSGVWAVRVAALDGTQGRYTVAFRIRRAKPVRLKGRTLGGEDPIVRTHAVPGLEGALLDLTVKWGRRSQPIGVVAIDDPEGDPVPGDLGIAVNDVVESGTKAVLRRHELATGDGDYAVQVGIAAGTAVYTLTARVTPQGRLRRRRTRALAEDEPGLSGSGPVYGLAGRPVRIAGRNFAEDAPPEVLFGGVRGTNVVVAVAGVALTVTPPGGEDGSLVAVTVANPDGQAVTKPDYFQYALPPTLTAITDLAGNPVLGGATAGGQTFRLAGTGLRTEHVVRFGDNVATVSFSPDPNTLHVVTPAAAPDIVRVFVDDEFGRTAQSPFLFEFKDAPEFDAQPYDPPLGALDADVTVTISGASFLASDELLIDGQVVQSTFVDASTRTFARVAEPASIHTVALRDRLGTVVPGPDWVVKGPATIASVRGVAGSYGEPAEAPLGGGATIEVLGTGFHTGDTVTLGADVMTVTQRTPLAFRFDAPPGAAGSRTLTVEDAIGQTVSLASAVRYAGYADATSARSPGGDAVDDLSALRGAIGDLDGDGAEDDLVVVSYGYYHENVYRGLRNGGAGTSNPPGTRAEHTRVLFGNAAGELEDRTATRFPAATTGALGDDWNAAAVAIGDLDRTNGADIVIGGVSPDYTQVNDVRLFRNDGSGSFALETADVLPHGYVQPVYAYDQMGASHLVVTQKYIAGLPTSLAVGDIDGDNDLDLVVGRDNYDWKYFYVDPKFVDYSQTPPFVRNKYVGVAYLLYRANYYPATKLFRNDLSSGGGWVDVTGTALPSAGDSLAAVVPALHARDLTLGDVDRDGDDDIVMTWDDPLTVSAYGIYAGADFGRVATRVLSNDGNGKFVDTTSTWMPPAVSPEFWQGHRLALADLDKDSDVDLLLLVRQSLDAFLRAPTYTRHALRILRNDGVANGFTDVTTVVLPPLPTDRNDNLRGSTLAVRDVNGDTYPDILVGTTEALLDGAGASVRSTRLLLGSAGFRFRLASGFLPAAAANSGQTDDLLIGDLAGSPGPSLILLSEPAPAASPGSERLRILDWKR